MLVVSIVGSRAASAAEQVYFPAVDNVTALLVQRINAETVRIDMSAWYLTEHAISIALMNRFNAGVNVRLIGDRGPIFEIDPLTRERVLLAREPGPAHSTPLESDLVSRDRPLEGDDLRRAEYRGIRFGQLHPVRARPGFAQQLQGRSRPLLR
jgi:hypothetical protein